MPSRVSFGRPGEPAPRKIRSGAHQVREATTTGQRMESGLPILPEELEHQALEVELRDGTRALVRPISAADKQRLREGFNLLSPRSRYLRFHAPVKRLTQEQLRYLTEIDYRDHMAWVATDLDHPEKPGMGVARYIRVSDEPEVGEAAVTVLDEYQGRGLGTLLLAILAKSARDNGIRTFRAYVLAENRPMLQIFEQLGAVRSRAEPGVFQVDLPFPNDPAGLPDTPAGRLFKFIARNELPSLSFCFPPVVRFPEQAEPVPPPSQEEQRMLREWFSDADL